MRDERNPSKLLVSVKSAAEATMALDAGADLIDVKDPSRGSLGMAHHETVSAVCDAVGTHVPVSAALGEWSPTILTDACWHLELPLTYLKWGLAGYTGGPGWGEDLLDTRREIPAGVEVVAVAYADWEKARSVPPIEVVKFAKRFRFAAFLLDTYQKDGRSLLDYCTVEQLQEWTESLQRSRVAVALAGSLKLEHLKKLKDVQPTWYAVRGAVCAGGKRDGQLDPIRIRKWKEAVSPIETV